MFKTGAKALLRLALIFSFQQIFELPVKSQPALETLAQTNQNLTCLSQRTLLLNASKGLLYPSESDYPFQYFYNSQAFSLSSAQEFTRLIGKQGQPVTQVDFDQFFNQLLDNLRSSGAEAETLKRYQSLREVFKTKFTTLTVYRVGQIQVQVYIIGVNSACGIAGLKIISIET